MTEDQLVSLVGALFGIFAFCGGFFDWDFFMNSRKARFFTAIFGRKGARIFYMILGALIAVAAALVLTGVLSRGDS